MKRLRGSFLTLSLLLSFTPAIARAGWVSDFCARFLDRSEVNSAETRAPAHFKLYEAPGKEANAFRTWVEKPVIGDQIEFSNGTVFTVHQVLGSGGKNYVIDIGNGEVIRIRSRSYRFSWRNLNPIMPDHTNLVDTLGEYVKGYTQLKKFGVRTVQWNIEESLPQEYIKGQKVTPLFFYGQFLNPEFRASLAAEINHQASDDLIRWAETTWRLRNIEDFRSDQMVFTKDHGWMLLDWGEQMIEADPTSTANVFETNLMDKMTNVSRTPGVYQTLVAKPGLPADLRERVLAAIMAKRSAAH